MSSMRPRAMAAVAFALGTCAAGTSAAWADPTGAANALGTAVDRCATIATPDARLACYDALATARRGGGVGPQDAAAVPVARDDGASYVERRWDLDDAASRGPFALLPDEANYLMPATYNFRPNQRPFPPQLLDVQPVEAKFQVSFKLKLAEQPLGLPGDLWLSYTQKSFWQVYASDQSAPFRETNYNPGLSWAIPARGEAFGLQWRALAFTVDHESNGRAAGLTRSWNRLAATAVVERGPFVGVLSGWVTQGTDDNPEITDYLGHARVKLGWHRGGHALSLAIRNPLDFDDGRLGAEAAWTFPLPFTRRVKGYLQWDYGYGESLLDYDVVGNRVGLGIALNTAL